jgi:hypothetical protein
MLEVVLNALREKDYALAFGILRGQIPTVREWVMIEEHAREVAEALAAGETIVEVKVAKQPAARAPDTNPNEAARAAAEAASKYLKEHGS